MFQNVKYSYFASKQKKLFKLFIKRILMRLDSQ